MPYPFRAGIEHERLQLIWDVYQWCGSQSSGTKYHWPSGPHGAVVEQVPVPCNKNRELPIAWDLAHIFAAIAGGYVIELSPHYKGVQLVRKNKVLWDRVSKFVKLKIGQACLPYDEGNLGDRWEHINNVSFFDVGA